MQISGGSFEFTLIKTFEGIEIHIYKKYGTGKLIKIDFSIQNTPGFNLLNIISKDEIYEVEEGLLLYTGRLNIDKLYSLMRDLKYKVGIHEIDPDKMSIEDKVLDLNKQMKKALDEEDYMKCAKIRDELKKLENVV